MARARSASGPLGPALMSQCQATERRVITNGGTLEHSTGYLPSNDYLRCVRVLLHKVRLSGTYQLSGAGGALYRRRRALARAARRLRYLIRGRL